MVWISLGAMSISGHDLRAGTAENYRPSRPKRTAGRRSTLHFTPTYSSWINQVERWLAELQRRCLERGVFCSLDELTRALEEWINLWNEDALSFPRLPDTLSGKRGEDQ